MKELTVISGKGGTGKTSLVASFAGLTRRAVLADCDVDASNLPLLLEPETGLHVDFYSGQTARIDESRCIGCGECANHCRFDAIRAERDGTFEERWAVDPIACEGCGVCSLVCPVEAVTFEESLSGEWFVSETRYGPMVHARLGIAADNSGKLVSTLRDMARKLARERSSRLILIDGSPGIGCPVIASVTGADLVLAVTEPTLSGLHDLERVAGLARHFTLPMAVIINKCDLHQEVAEQVEVYCRDNEIAVAGRIPFAPEFTEAMVLKKSVVEYGRGPAVEAVTRAWREVERLLALDGDGTAAVKTKNKNQPTSKGSDE